MTALHAPEEPSVRSHLSSDHVELERTLARLIEAVEVGDREGVSVAWTGFEDRLAAHFDAEEQFLIPAILPGNPRVAAAILAEHRHLRARLAELAAGVDLHIVSLRMVRAFIDEIRAHAAHEDRLLYRWADEAAPDSARAPLLQAIGALPSTDSSAASSSSTCTGLVK